MTRRIMLVVCAAMVLASAAGAADIAKFKPKMAAVFKNGLGFIVRTGEARFADGWAVTDFVPQATLGTFWMSTPAAGSYVEEIVAYNEDIEKAIDARTLEELLRANVGKKVTLVLSGTTGAEQPTVAGTLLPMPEQPDPSAPRAPNPGVDDRLIYIKTADGTITVVPRPSITRVVWTEDPNRKTTYKEPGKRIKFRVKNGRDGAPVTMAYLSKGITWTPSYLIDIEDAKKARMTFKSTLSNDLEDMEGVDVLFVVGYPNFAFSDQLSPMALQQSVSDLIRGVVTLGENRRAYMSNWATQSMNYDGGYGGSRPAPSVSDYTTVGTPGQSEADLFLYSKPNVSIKKGERAEYTIFTAIVDYEHIYEWTVDDSSGVDPFGYRVQPSSDREVKPKDAVWHSLRLTNATDYPWTTAPALVVSGNKPLSQDELAYTSKKAKGTLKMTVATDISVAKDEVEVERQHDVKINYNTFDQVTVQGELSLTNYKSEPAKLIVKKNLTGEVLSTDPETKVTKTAAGLAGVNPRSIIEWEFTLNPGETKKLTFKAKTYVRL